MRIALLRSDVLVPRPERNRLRAIILDVDGTLYNQQYVRMRMLLRLLSSVARTPVHGLSVVRALRAFRRAQEFMRRETANEGITVTLAARQIELAAQRSDLSVEFVREVTDYWMNRSPLDLVARARRPGVVEFLTLARSVGLRIGICSDYPADAKLTAMGLGSYVDTVVSAQDESVGRFKPNPRGIQVALANLGVPADQAMYVGDRQDVDAPAGRAAGVYTVILTNFRELRTEYLGH